MTATLTDARQQSPAPRKPRKIFLLIGTLLAVALGIGLFTSLGTTKASGAPHAGGPVPSFTASRLNGSGSVKIPSTGTPTVLLFFGNWCEACHTEMPPLATAVRVQSVGTGPLSRVRVVGVDSEDSPASAKGFIHHTGITFPVAYDPNLSITSGDFYFQGDPYSVFVNGNGTIERIVAGPISVATFTADERTLAAAG
jgi:peroxiredoxin